MCWCGLGHNSRKRDHYATGEPTQRVGPTFNEETSPKKARGGRTTCVRQMDFARSSGERNIQWATEDKRQRSNLQECGCSSVRFPVRCGNTFAPDILSLASSTGHMWRKSTDRARRSDLQPLHRHLHQKVGTSRLQLDPSRGRPGCVRHWQGETPCYPRQTSGWCVEAPVDTVVLELVDHVIERYEWVVDGDHFNIGIRRRGTEHEHSNTTEVINAQLCRHGSQTVNKNTNLVDH